MIWVVVAHGVVLVHVGFVAFVLIGGVLVARWPWVAWLHVPAVVWAVTLEWSASICPLTPLENELRSRGGLSPYEGDFVGRYVLPVLYPAGLTRAVQIALGGVALAVNTLIYGLVWCRRWRGRHPASERKKRV